MTDERQENMNSIPRESPQELAGRRRKEILGLARDFHREVTKLRADCLQNPLWGMVQDLISRVSASDDSVTLASPSDALFKVVGDLLPATTWFNDDARVRRAYGLLLGKAHSWFVVELPGEDVGEPSPWWRFIIDPAVPDASPQCILLGPGSPIQLAYRDERDYPEAMSPV